MKKKNYKSGAASFYVVAFSTLILVVLAASFASAIVAEIIRSSNDDLSQSAYDAALAGVEDAKLALASYQNCLEKNAVAKEPSGDGAIECGEIIYWVEKEDCDMVAHILGRIDKEVKEQEVLIDEGGSNDLDQAYTCVKMKTRLSDYRSVLNSQSSYRVARVKMDSGKANTVKKVKVSWYLNDVNYATNYSNFNKGNEKVEFGSTPSTPPTLAVELVQVDKNDKRMSKINKKTTVNNKTDRATVFLVPTNDKDSAKDKDNGTYVGVYNDSQNILTSAQVASTNNHAKNLPFLVYCGGEDTAEFICSATLELPSPIPPNDIEDISVRDEDNFALVVYLPYNQPDTDFAMEFLDESGNVIDLVGMQVLIDATGRANDLFRRVEVRLEPDNGAAFPLYAVYAGEGIEKNITTEEEHGDYDSYFENPDNY